MGKRSDFPRLDRDNYATPYKAVPPLIPHIQNVKTFAEPCCGAGELVLHLESHGRICGYHGDIANGEDALALDSYGRIDAIITNPPYRRELMHELISHFAKIAPTWLLLEYDWTATQQARMFMRMCSHVVIVGRLKWIPDSKYTGKENYAWCRFNASHRHGPRLYT